MGGLKTDRGEAKAESLQEKRETNMRVSLIGLINKFLFVFLAVILMVTFFTRNNYRGVDAINPELFEDPVQTPAASRETIEFTKDNFHYRLTPLYDYQISALIVSRMDYTFASIYKYESVFPMDLCLIWGTNVESGVFRNKALTFSQDSRFCRYRWQGRLDFNSSQFSNNHLVVNSPEIEKAISRLTAGDQIRITGKLVRVRAENLGSPGKYDPPYFEWNTSVGRDDSGAGACEVIYVESLQVLERANPVSKFLFTASWRGLIILAVLNIAVFIISLFKLYPRVRS